MSLEQAGTIWFVLVILLWLYTAKTMFAFPDEKDDE